MNGPPVVGFGKGREVEEVTSWEASFQRVDNDKDLVEILKLRTVMSVQLRVTRARKTRSVEEEFVSRYWRWFWGKCEGLDSLVHLGGMRKVQRWQTNTQMDINTSLRCTRLHCFRERCPSGELERQAKGVVGTSGLLKTFQNNCEEGPCAGHSCGCQDSRPPSSLN